VYHVPHDPSSSAHQTTEFDCHTSLRVTLDKVIHVQFQLLAVTLNCTCCNTDLREDHHVDVLSESAAVTLSIAIVFSQLLDKVPATVVHP
jgi:hypothetical protein